jgi:hypothetical protein
LKQHLLTVGLKCSLIGKFKNYQIMQFCVFLFCIIFKIITDIEPASVLSGVEIIQLFRYQSIVQLPFKVRLQVEICGIIETFLMTLLRLLCSQVGNLYVEW